ncbi:MAG: DUF1003 domain-containing protein [Candidatus Methylarchaceae archaeon HK02M2]|nr:DUF1003 domain-containing protein [Candidatus Methylarchaceae archaeon HK02M2]
MAQKNTEQAVICQICKKPKKMSEVLSAELIREPIVKEIQKTYPDWSTSGFICIDDLNHFRAEYIQDIIEADKGELSALEEQVVKSLQEQELLSTNINIEYDKQLTLGERLADRIADFGGSWGFISIFIGVLLLWVAINSTILVRKPFDPYPYIFLNLILSCLAAIQAPVIMMSQNRQEAKDRLRAEYDYRINLKAELEIRHLQEKIDHLLMNQWNRLLEIQKIQIDLMEELSHKKS